MRLLQAALAAVLTILAIPAYGASSETLSLAGGPDFIPVQGRTPVFSPEAKKIKASVSISLNEKTPVEFKWMEPSGKTFADTAKIVYPVSGHETAVSADVLEIPGAQLSARLGWWRVEVSISDKKLSTRFLLTKNRQTLTLAGGDKKEKIRTLLGFDLKDPGAKEMISIAAGAPDDEIRADAARALRGVQDEYYKSILKTAQGDSSPLVRAEAYNSYIIPGNDACAAEVVRAAVDPAPEVRAVAAAYVSAGTPDGIALLAVLIRDIAPVVRERALNKLRASDSDQAVRTMAEGLVVEDPDFKKEIVDAIAAKKGRGRVDALVAGLKSDNPWVNLRCLELLSGEKLDFDIGAVRALLGHPDIRISSTALQVLDERADADGLLQAYQTGAPGIRIKAAGYLAGLGGGKGARGLESVVRDADLQVRKTAVIGLVRSGLPGVPGLIVALGDSDDGIRLQAVAALVEMKAEGVREPMLRMLTDPKPSVRKKTLEYFIAAGGPGLPQIIEKTACDPEAGIRSAGIEALSKIPGEAASKALTAYALCGDIYLRRTITEILAARKDPVAMESLKAALRDDDDDIRFKAAATLLRDGLYAPLTSLVADKSPAVRKVALRAMAVSPGPSMLAALAGTAKEADYETRSLTVQVLKGIPGEAAGAIVSDMVSDPSGDVRALARVIVLDRRDQGAVKGIGQLIYDPDVSTRRKALAALSDIPGAASDGELLNAVSKAGPDEKIAAIGIISGRGGSLVAEAVKKAVNDVDGRVMAAGFGQVKNVPEPYLDGVYLAALTSPEPGIRKAGLLWLGGRGMVPDNMNGIRKMLGDPVPEIRREAISALVGIKDQMLPRLLPRLLKDSDPDVVAGAFEAAMAGGNGDDAAGSLGVILGRMYKRGSREEAFKAFVDETADAGTRLRLLDIAEKKGLPAKWFVLLIDDGDIFVRLRATEALTRLDGAEAAYGVLAVGGSTDQRISGMASEAVMKKDAADIRDGVRLLFERGRASLAALRFAVGTIRQADALRLVVDKTISSQKDMLGPLSEILISRREAACVPAMLDAIKSGDAAIRERTAAALASIPGPEPGRELADIYKAYPGLRHAMLSAAAEPEYLLPAGLHDDDPAVRREAAARLAGLKASENAFEILSTGVKSADAEVREASVNAAGRLGYVAVLETASKDALPRLRKLAAMGLSGIKDEKAVPVLERLVRDPDPEVSREAVGSMLNKGESVPASVWASVAGGGSCVKASRLSSLSVLAGRQDMGSLPLVVSLLGAPDPEIREAAGRTVRAYGKKSLPQLYPLLREPPIRRSALEILKDINDPSSGPEILRCLPDMEGEDLVFGIAVIRDLGGEGAGTLCGYYKGAPADIQSAVVKAIGKLGISGAEKQVLEVLADAVDNQSPEVRFYAAHSAAGLGLRDLRGKLEARLKVEDRALVKSEIAIALKALSD